MARAKAEKSDVAPSSEGAFSINSVLKTLRKKRPDSTISILQESGELSGTTIPYFLSTGLMNVDWVLGKGLPASRLIEIYSNSPGEGKSSLLASIIKSAQKDNYVVLLLDSENGTIADRLVSLGVDPNNLLFESPSSMEKGFDLIDLTIKTIREMDENVKILVAWDSIGAATTEAELAADFEARTIGVQSRVLSSSIKKGTTTYNFSKLENGEPSKLWALGIKPNQNIATCYAGESQFKQI